MGDAVYALLIEDFQEDAIGNTHTYVQPIAWNEGPQDDGEAESYAKDYAEEHPNEAIYLVKILWGREALAKED